jgi:hypothetical protein
LASYEHGYNPVPYWVAAKISAETNICQRWLATGKAPMKPYLAVDQAFDDMVPRSLPFSSVYDSILQEAVDSLIDAMGKSEGVTMEALGEFAAEYGLVLFSTTSTRLVSSLGLNLKYLSQLARRLPTASAESLVGNIENLISRYERMLSEHGEKLRNLREEEDAAERAALVDMIQRRISRLVEWQAEKRRGSRTRRKVTRKSV